MAVGGKGQRGQSQSVQLSGNKLPLFFHRPGDGILICVSQRLKFNYRVLKACRLIRAARSQSLEIVVHYFALTTCRLVLAEGLHNA